MEADSFSLAYGIAAIPGSSRHVSSSEATKGQMFSLNLLYQLQYCQMSLSPTHDGDLFPLPFVSGN